MSSRNLLKESTLEVIESFDDMRLAEDLLRGIYCYGWENPTPIQQRAILPMVEGRDIIAQAQSGTGKTGAFGTAALQIVDKTLMEPQILILSPTRELADQTHEVLVNLNAYRGLQFCRCVGGVRVRDNINDLRNAQIVIGTPGRVLHMLNEGYFHREHLTTLVLDEADEMLDRGFFEAMTEVFQIVPNEIQVCLFSATFPQEIVDMSNKFMRENAARILVKQEEVSLDGIRQYYVNVEHHDYKLATLLDLFTCFSVAQTIIFCNTRRQVEQLHDEMTRDDFTCSCIHGEMSNDERKLRVREFKTGASRVLIATDVLARGFDADVQMVINYELPHMNYENYIHRIGRSGRRGKKGVSINLMTDSNKDLTTHRGLEAHYSTKIEELPSDVADVV